MNPIKQVEEVIETVESYTATTFHEVENTKFFNTEKYEPGQPGVFEVNPVAEFDCGEPCRRFSFWNGRAYGPIMPFPEQAYEARFDKATLSHTITAFRGLTEQA